MCNGRYNEKIFNGSYVSVLLFLDNCISCTILKFFNETKSSKSALYPTELYVSLKNKSARFKNMLNGKVQDAHEFLLLAAEEMESLHHSMRWFESSFIADIRTIIQCSTCKNVFKSDGHCGDFCVNIYGKSVQSALDMYFEWESVNAYSCPCCEKEVTAKKKFSLVSSPSCLCITLKRFSKNSKINRNVNITSELTTSDYFFDTPADDLPTQCKYKLVAVINHIGKTRSSGHYTTVVSQKDESYEFDDSVVRIVNGKANKGNEAYMLFYERTEVICRFLVCNGLLA